MIHRVKIVLCCLLISQLEAQTDLPVSYLQKHIYTLASDSLEGRQAGTPGGEAAAAYIASEFKTIGLLPFGDNNTYNQSFEFVSDIKLGEKNTLSSLSGKKETHFKLQKDFRPLGFSSNGSVTGTVVFAGYGLSSRDLQYDDYEQIDVKNKIVIVMRYSPSGDSSQSVFMKYTPQRYKVLTAREKGAAAVIFCTGAADDSVDRLMPLKYDNSTANSGIPVLTVTRDVVDKWLSTKSLSVDSIQRFININRKPFSVDLNSVTAAVTMDVIEIKSKTANLVGLLQVTDTASSEYIIIGAHYDHLGYGGEFALDKSIKAIHNGADDNASGSGGILELARLLMKEKRNLRHNILFIAFSAEEYGVIGSTYYTRHPKMSLSNVRVMLNLDMVGRLKNKTLTVQGTGTSPSWPQMLHRLNADSSFVLKMLLDGYGGSDQTPFYSNSIPVLFFFTGLHEDYHKATDDADKINYEGEAKIVQFVRKIVIDIDQNEKRPDFVKAAAPERTSGDSRGNRVYVGTIPDFSDQADGFKMSGVRESSPAAKAGMQAGDIIIKFGKFDIKNIYDYTYAIQEYKPGDDVLVTIKRGTEKIVIHVLLEKRN